MASQVFPPAPQEIHFRLDNLEWCSEGKEPEVKERKDGWAVMINHEYDSGLKNGLSLEGAHLLPSENLGVDSALSMIRIQSNIGW